MSRRTISVASWCQIHVWQIFASRLDEGEQAIQKIGAFVRKHTA